MFASRIAPVKNVWDLFSKRQKRERGELPEVFVYDEIPQPLRVQIVHIWRDAFGDATDYETGNRVRACYESVRDGLCREYGVFQLTESKQRDSTAVDLINFVLDEPSAERVLDAVQLTFQVIDTHVRKGQYQIEVHPQLKPDDAIAELNFRFMEHGVGYQFESGRIIRKDSELLHQEAVRPALEVLRAGRYAGASKEFHCAHRHCWKGRYEDCLGECLKAFESVLKVICDERKWEYLKGATARDLISLVLDGGLVPKFLESQFGALRSLLESGIPTVRNRLDAHGRGGNPRDVPGYYASFLLHLTAATVLFLAESDKETR